MSNKRIVSFILEVFVGVNVPIGGALAQVRDINIPPEPLKQALDEYIKQSAVELVYKVDEVAGLRSEGAHGRLDSDQALAALLNGTGFVVQHDASGAMVVSRQPTQIDAREPEAAGNTEQVTVTGSRVITDPVNSPTPVTTVTAQELLATTPSNIPDALNTLPVFDSSRNQRTTGGSTINWPGNFLNLRNFGTNRTLILLDGMRVPATDASNDVDSNTIPQALIERVDVVTGGASAVYGSDAITGVVNFVLDHKFEGFKAEVQGGISNYGDSASQKYTLVYGGDMFGGRGHLELSAQYYHEDGIDNDFARPLGILVPQELGAGTAASPYHIAFNMRNVNLTPGGYIASGPLANMTFASNGVLSPFTHGAPGNGPNEIGGDGGYSGEAYSLFPGVDANPWLTASLASEQLFGRFDYDITNNIHAFVMSNVNQSENFNSSGVQSITNQVFASDNAYLPATAKSLLGCPTTGIYAYSSCTTQSFAMSKAFDNESGAISAGYIQNINVMAGVNGTLWGYDWDMHYTHGVSTQHESAPFTIDQQNLQAALDAVVNPATGQIVCRVSLTAAGAAAYPGCTPFNAFGPSANNLAAWEYATTDITYKNINTMDDFGASMNGTVFDGWAGPIKAALDLEYRNISLQTISAYSPTQKVNCTYQNPLTCNSSLAVWNGTVANLNPVAENVVEGAVETDAPLLKDLPLVELFDLNAAARWTQYSTSGDATTWKLGAVWSVNDDIKFRGTVSRDIRAPTLSNLFAPVSANYTAFTDYLTGISSNTTTQSQGNPNLKPEVSRTNTVGFSYTPSWLQGFTALADFYQISIHNVINSISGGSATSEQICLASGGTSPYCALIVRPISYDSTSPANFPTTILSESLNSGAMTTHGVDGEIDYSTQLSNLWDDAPGSISSRIFISYQPSLLSISQVPGAPPTQQAGAEGSSTGQAAAGRVTGNLGWTDGIYAITVSERWHSSERPNANPTLIFTDPSVPQIFYTDMSVSYNFKLRSADSDNNAQLFFTMQNVFNKQPSIYIATSRTGAEGYAYPASFDEDVIGRYMTLGLRYKF